MPSREQLGTLSRAEDALTDSQRELKLRLEDERYETSQMLAWYRANALPRLSDSMRELVEEYAEYAARDALVRDRLERMGFLS